MVTLSQQLAAKIATAPEPSQVPVTITDPDLAQRVPAGETVWPLALEQQVRDAAPGVAVSIRLVRDSTVLLVVSTSDRPFG